MQKIVQHDDAEYQKAGFQQFLPVHRNNARNDHDDGDD